MGKYRSDNAALILLGYLPIDLVVVLVLHLGAAELPDNLLKSLEGMLVRTVFVPCFLKGLDEVLFLVVPLVSDNLVDQDVFRVKVYVEAEHVSQHKLLLKFVLLADLTVVNEASGVDNCFEHSIE